MALVGAPRDLTDKPGKPPKKSWFSSLFTDVRHSTSVELCTPSKMHDLFFEDGFTYFVHLRQDFIQGTMIYPKKKSVGTSKNCLTWVLSFMLAGETRLVAFGQTGGIFYSA